MDTPVYTSDEYMNYREWRPVIDECDQEDS